MEWQNKIFSDLIKGDDDFVGKIAYFLYKQEKLSWLADQESSQGRPPTDEEVIQYFLKPNSRPEALERFRREAETSVNQFIQLTLFEELSRHKENLKDSEVLKKVQKPFWTSVKESVVAGLIASAITVIFSIALWLYTEMKSQERRNQLINNVPALSDSAKEELKRHLNQ